MIKVTRIDGKPMLINELNIETVCETPDTIITFSNGKNYVIKETMDELMGIIDEQFSVNFRRFIQTAKKVEEI